MTTETLRKPAAGTPVRSSPDRASNRALLAGLLFFAATLALAAAPQGAAPARFVVESIRVEGARQVPEEILIAESRLRPDSAYDAEQLRRAAHRVQRLPFVLHADLELTPGTAPGQHVALLVVRETASWSLAYESSWRSIDGEPAAVETMLAGGRHFAGRADEIFALLDNGPNATLGYTRYRLLGGSAFVRATLRRNVCCDRVRLFEERRFNSGPSDFFDDLTEVAGDLLLSLPLAGDQRLQVLVQAERIDAGRSFTPPQDLPPVVTRRETRRETLQLEWLLDTTDDDLLPRRGHRLAASAFASERRSGSDLIIGGITIDTSGDPEERARIRFWGNRLETGHYWSPRERRTLLLETGLHHFEATGSDFGMDLRFGYAHTLLAPGGSRPGHELRVEGTAHLTDPSFRSASDLHFPGAEIRLGLVYRSRWSVTRLELSHREPL